MLDVHRAGEVLPDGTDPLGAMGPDGKDDVAVARPGRYIIALY
jgi:hypothetical protein